MQYDDDDRGIAVTPDAVFATVALAVHPREGRSKHARVNLPVGHLQTLTGDAALNLIASLADACGSSGS